MEFLKYLKLLPIISAHPNLQKLMRDNMAEVHQFIDQLLSVVGEHEELLQKIEAAGPEIMVLINELTPAIREIQAQR